MNNNFYRGECWVKIYFCIQHKLFIIIKMINLGVLTGLRDAEYFKGMILICPALLDRTKD